MRKNVKPQPEIGDRRTVTKFLLFPKTIGTEWRWLERATIIQQYVRQSQMSYGWKDLYWEDDYHDDR